MATATKRPKIKPRGSYRSNPPQNISDIASVKSEESVGIVRELATTVLDPCEAILQFLRVQEKQVTGTEIADGIGMKIHDVLKHTQVLTNQGKVELLIEKVNQKTKIFFQLGNEISRKLATLTSDEQAIYNAIESAGTAGIWNAKLKSIIPDRSHLKRVLTRLTREQLVKEFKPVNNSKKPHYILFELEPDETVSGGVFYDGDEFDREFISNLRKIFLHFLLQRYNECESQSSPYLRFKNTYVTPQEIATKLNSSGVIKVKLSPDDCEKVLQTLVADRLAVENKAVGSIRAFRASKHERSNSAMSVVPCGVCPVRHNCSLTGVVNPISCKYMKDWLEF